MTSFQSKRRMTEDKLKPHYSNTDNPIDFPKSEKRKQIEAGANIHAGDGYEISTKEKYEAFVEKRMESEAREHIGYIEREEGYYKLYAPPKGSIVTHAFILCKYCNGAIYHCMGPKYDAVCFTCYDKDPELR